MNKRIVSSVAAGLMVMGGGLVAVPSASAYPAGADPKVGIAGRYCMAPGTATAARSFNFQPGCRVVMTVVGTSISRTRLVQASGQSLAAFRAPARKGQYTVRVRQVADGACMALLATNRITVR